MSGSSGITSTLPTNLTLVRRPRKAGREPAAGEQPVPQGKERRLLMKWTSASLIAAALSFTAAAQTPETKLNCTEHSGNHNRLATHCEIKEQTMPASGGVIDIQPGENGGISVQGWERADVLVRARIRTSAPTDAEARAL